MSSHVYAVIRNEKGKALVDGYYLDIEVLLESIRLKLAITEKQEQAIRLWWAERTGYNVHETIEGLTVILCFGKSLI